jgi:hypothetical protein
MFRRDEMTKVFISHASPDRLFVDRLVIGLKGNDLSVWYDNTDLQAGDSLRQTIGQAIEGCDWLLVVLSKDSVKSPWVVQELNSAFAFEISRRSVFIVPALIDDCKIPAFLNDKVVADFRSSYDQGLSSLLDRFGCGNATLGKLVYDTLKEVNLLSKWILYCMHPAGFRGIRQFINDDGTKGFFIRAYATEDVGVNCSVRCVYGSAVFYYKVLQGDPARQNILFAMIPMQENGLGRTGLIEVGSNYQNAPTNARSPHRRRFCVPEDNYVSGQWHRGVLEFDFRNTASAFYSIFAPRINEGCDRKGTAEILLGEVKIYSRE